MLRFDKIFQADTCQLLTDTIDVDAQSVVIYIQLVIPQKLDNITAGTDFTRISEQVVEDFQLVFGQLHSLSLIF